MYNKYFVSETKYSNNLSYINMHMVKVYGTSLPEKLTNEDQCERFIRALSNGQFIPPQKNRECYDSGK